MSWLFSRVLVAQYSQDSCSDGEQFAQLNLMQTAHKFSRNGKTIEHSKFSRFGLTLDHLTESRGEELLTLFRADFHARTYQQPEREPELAALGLVSGKSSPELLAKYDPVTCSLKTVHSLKEKALTLSSAILPRSGMMRNGCVYLRRSVALTTSAIAYGYSPTLTASSANKEVISSRGGRNIIAVAKLNLPTLTVKGNYNRKGLSKTSGDGLVTALKKRMPTLRAQSTNGSGPSRVGNREDLQTLLGGQLNPEWCEWYMGWPVGFTGFAPLATGKYREWLQQHSVF